MTLKLPGRGRNGTGGVVKTDQFHRCGGQAYGCNTHGYPLRAVLESGTSNAIEEWEKPHNLHTSSSTSSRVLCHGCVAMLQVCTRYTPVNRTGSAITSSHANGKHTASKVVTHHVAIVFHALFQVHLYRGSAVAETTICSQFIIYSDGMRSAGVQERLPDDTPTPSMA